jgi:hypothetical protein
MRLSAIFQRLKCWNRCKFALCFQKVLTLKLHKVGPTLHEFIVGSWSGIRRFPENGLQLLT